MIINRNMKPIYIICVLSLMACGERKMENDDEEGWD